MTNVTLLYKDEEDGILFEYRLLSESKKYK
ncbi:hypothetical protein HLPCO_001097 [Haloplasma contractile SSD-17B]|uniref:Uncharacterized protein n=1 Tax=Haloplasma contractile SSD-17B TaxID=1033810 RepID=U2DWS5_9MOLU|nr:hypothetical protein HLPCO_001097 [Haloplasma contractile SSD-17B]